MSDEEIRRHVDEAEVVDIPTGGRLKAVSIEAFLRMELPPREMLLGLWLPGQGLVMVFAPRGVGKTYVALGIAYAVSSGGQFLKWEAPKARRVLYIDGEMPGVVMQERLAGIVGASDKEAPGDFLRLITPDLQEYGIPDLATPEGQAEIEHHLVGVELVVLDNLSTLCRSGAENEAESWGVVQEWALGLRRRGISVLFVHHAGKSGQQRGTSAREDVLDTVISLRRPTDYMASDGARFEVHFDKARGVYGDDVRSFEAKLETRDGHVFWTMKDSDDSAIERVAEAINAGLSIRDAAKEAGVSKSTAQRHKLKAAERGLLNEEI